jgi:hypothetical protein
MGIQHPLGSHGGDGRHLPLRGMHLGQPARPHGRHPERVQVSAMPCHAMPPRTDKRTTRFARGCLPALRSLPLGLASVRAARVSRGPSHSGTVCTRTALLRACRGRYWAVNDFRNPNWWWNELGIPNQVQQASVLMKQDLTTDQV